MARASMHVSLLAALASAAFGAALVDKDKSCGHWADTGECETNPTYMMSNCAASCSRSQDTGDSAECHQLVTSGGCSSREVALVRCRASCFRALQKNLTSDTEGNCWYWGTDGECEANSAWMLKSCSRSCSKLRACAAAPESAACSEPFECPLQRDRDDEDECAKRALAGECRAGSAWQGDSLLLRCPYSCSIIDPQSASHTVTRPRVRRSSHIDAHVPHNHPLRCHEVGFRRALLSASCPHPSDADDKVPWRRRWRKCPREAGRGGVRGVGVPGGVAEQMTPRIFHSELPPPPKLPAAARSRLMGESPPPIWLQVVHDSPRVRVLHNFVSPEEAAYLIKIATPLYHRSSTARAGSDDKRTSSSATLMSSDDVVMAVRHRVAFYCGYPEPNLEPLQTVRYHPGEFYKPHHDYYNACETWQQGNRHFTFLIYLNDVEEGGETTFPRLNVTVRPKAYTALVFNNCLDNGEPDERSLHEGVAPTRGVKYAINGWVRSKHNSWQGRRAGLFS